MNIKQLNKELSLYLKESIEIADSYNDDVLEIKNIIPVLQGYKEHLYTWLDDEPENAKEQGAENIINAIDIVIAGIKDID